MSQLRIFLIGLVSIYLVAVGYFVFLKEGTFGAGYRPVTGYQASLTSFLDDVTASTTINVNTTKDPAGNEISLTNISPSSTVRVYLNIEPGTSREESVFCTGKSTNQWTGCVRGLNFQGGTLTASSTLAKDHNAGSKIIMSNIGQFYGEYVSTAGDETVYGVKTFDSFPTVTNTSALPTGNGQFATKLYVDNVGAGGFTNSNVASSSGLYALGTSPETVGVNISTTSSGLTFDSSFGGKLKVSVSSTSIGIDSLGRLYWDRTLNYRVFGTWQFDGNVTTTGNLQVNTPTSSADVANKGYVDSNIYFGYGTGTVGAPITAGRAIYISSTSSLFHSDSSNVTSTISFVGLALETVSTGTIRYARPGEIACPGGGLGAGQKYYVNGTAGQLSAAGPGIVSARVATAISTSCLLVRSPSIVQSGTLAVTGTGSTNIYTGFYPARIVIRAAETSVAGTPGSMSVGDDTNMNTFVGFDGTNAVGGADASNAFRVVTTASLTGTSGTVSAKANTGFTINVATFVDNTTLQWTAYSE